MNNLKNPYLPLDTYIPDGEPRVFGDTLYIYGSCDVANSDNYCLGEYKVAYAKLNDLANFKVVPSYSFKDSNMTFEEGGQFQAPDCVEYKNKYYLFYNRMKRFEVEVAIADKPTGPFKFYGFIHHKDGNVPNDKLFDPGIFVDDDERIYLYTGFCPSKNSRFANLARKYSQVFELEEDMLTIKDGPYDLIPGPIMADGTPYEGHAFFEASSMRKFNGKYYFIYSSENSHDLCYAISDYPNKGFEYKGVLVSNANIGYNGNNIPELPYGNTHGSIAYFNNNYYIFYHRQTSGKECSRQACAELLVMDSNGLFKQAEMTTQGLNGKPLSDIFDMNANYACLLISDKENPKLKIGFDYKDEISTFREDEDNSSLHYINIIGNTLVGFKYFDFKEANYIKLEIEASSGEVFIRQERNGANLLSFKLDNNKLIYEGYINFNKGIYPLYIEFKNVDKAIFRNISSEKR